MTDISASAVKALRDRTGAGMMDCKRALQETDGDPERAIDVLRKKGAATAEKRAGRETSEGIVQVADGAAGGPAAMVEVATETDFVARNEEFVAFARRAASIARDAGVPGNRVGSGDDLLDLPADDPLRKEINELRAKIGENIRLRRFVRYPAAEDGAVGSYTHFGNRIGVLVEVAGAGDRQAGADVAREIALHVAAADPAGITPEDIAEDVRRREEALYREQAEEEGKPPEIIEKIVEGRMRKFYEENALLRQGFVRDPDVTIEELLEKAGNGASVRRFTRFEVGD